MAKFVGGPPPFIGTRDNVTIYLMNGEYYIRSKSSLTGKRVKRDPAFARTMQYAGWLKKASGIASLVYKQMPEDTRVYKQYRELVGKAMRLLKEGFEIDDVLAVLEVAYLADHSTAEVSHVMHEAEKTGIKYPVLNKPRKIKNDNRQNGVRLYKVFGKEAFATKRNATNRRRFRTYRVYTSF